jgi:glycerol uptake facilitator-like aquaporin
MSSNLGIFLAEFIGTFIFLSVILTIASSNAKSYAPLAIGLALTVAVLFAWDLSGGHLNPAVTFMSYMNGSTSGMKALVYVVAQLLGAYAAITFRNYIR